jgi:hypothetical protein
VYFSIIELSNVKCTGMCTLFEIGSDILLYITVLVSALLMGVVIGRLKGIKPDISDIKFNKSWLLIPAIGLQILSSIAEAKGLKFSTLLTVAVNGVVFGLVFLVIWLNRRYIGLWFMGFGALLNALVMLLNGGRMPVDISLAGNAAYMAEPIEIIKSGMDNKHAVISTTTKLPILADIINVPGFLGLGMPIISIGDIIVAIGLFILCLQFCLFKTVPRN